MLEIAGVELGGIGEDMGLEEGDAILTINSHEINDPLDFTFYTATSDNHQSLNIVVRKGDGSLLEVDAELDYGDDLGLNFPPIEALKCQNRCSFCFVHQLPKGLRRTLYVKDEDYRLSFLMGNYVTLARARKNEIERIKEQRLSPLYISVHSTDPVVREKLLGVKPDWEIIGLMQELASAGIKMHTQIVVCPGINDGEDLKRSIEELYRLFPSVLSLSVVPVGLTSHRERLPDLRPVGQKDAVETIAEVETLQERFRREARTSFVFLADEYYLKAGTDVPSLDHYEDLHQVENGVGMLAYFRKEAAEVIEEASRLEHAFDCSVITGLSPAGYLRPFMDTLGDKTGCTIRLFPILNKLFGDSVTVTGLISGRDIAEQLKGKPLGEVLFIPDIILKEGDGRLIDDYTPEIIGEELGVDVVPFESGAAGFAEALYSFGKGL